MIFGYIFGVWSHNMLTLWKRKELWRFTNIVVPSLNYDKEELMVNGKKKYEVVSVMTTYIYGELR